MLAVPIPPPNEPGEEDDPPSSRHLPFTRSSHSHFQPFSPIWSNSKWQNLVGSHQLLECLSIEGAREFGDWLSGARAARGKPVGPSAAAKTAPTHFGYGSRSKRAEGYEQAGPSEKMELDSSKAPEGFWEPENPPYEDLSNTSDPASSSDSNLTGIESASGSSGHQTLKVDFVQPGKVTLELTKTNLPIYQVGRGNARSKLGTHSFIVITSVPLTPLTALSAPKVLADDSRQRRETVSEPRQHARHLTPHAPKTTILDAPPDLPKRPGLSLHPSSVSAERSTSNPEIKTPTDEITALDLSQTPSKPHQPLLFNRDGTVSRRKGQQGTGGQDGKSLDVNVLFETTDWSQTPLGPRDSWPQSLKSIGDLPAAVKDEWTLMSSVIVYAVSTRVLFMVGQGPDLDIQLGVRRSERNDSR